MARLDTTVGKRRARRTPTRRVPGLTRVPATTAPSAEPPAARCLLVEGRGSRDSPEFLLAVEAMEALAHVLRGAMERARPGGETLGLVEKSWLLAQGATAGEWKVRVPVPRSITATALELARHLVGHHPFAGQISLAQARGYPID